MIVDTAGRLHTQDHLMEELRKIHRVIGQRLEGAPHEVLLTIDATTGQNGLQQARLFAEAVDVTGIVLTKLDGTAKGGIALAIAHELGIPVKLIGMGEGHRGSAAVRPASTSATPCSTLTRTDGSPAAPTTLPTMFDSLSDRLGGTLDGLRGKGRLSEDDINKAMREIRLALLEADVNFARRQGLRRHGQGAGDGRGGAGQPDARPAGREDRPRGADVADGHGRREALVRQPAADRDPDGRPPGLGQDDGRRQAGAAAGQAEADAGAWWPPTSTGRPPSSSCRRSASRSRCRSSSGATADPVETAAWGIEQAKAQGRDVVIVDTAGRLPIDQELMDELVRIKAAVKPHNVLLVLDSMTGQDAVATAPRRSREAVDYDGVILTKLDGDARGGAALAVRAVTGKPIKFSSVGEKLDQLEEFHPDRMASRILGMGDVMSLIERAQEEFDEKQAAEMEAKLRKAEFTLEDFLDQLRMVRKMTARPGPGRPAGHAAGRRPPDQEHEGRRAAGRPGGGDHPVDDAVRAAQPEADRRQPPPPDRRGVSGTNVQTVNQLLGQFKQMQKMMKQVGQGQDAPVPGHAAPLSGRPG